MGLIHQVAHSLSLGSFLRVCRPAQSRVVCHPRSSCVPTKPLPMIVGPHHYSSSPHWTPSLCTTRTLPPHGTRTTAIARSHPAIKALGVRITNVTQTLATNSPRPGARSHYCCVGFATQALAPSLSCFFDYVAIDEPLPPSTSSCDPLASKSSPILATGCVRRGTMIPYVLTIRRRKPAATVDVTMSAVDMAITSTQCTHHASLATKSAATRTLNP